MSAPTIEDMSDEINTDALDQLTDLKLMINKIQSSIPKDRVTLEYFISNELANVIKALHQHSSTTEMAILQDTLLKEFSSNTKVFEEGEREYILLIVTHVGIIDVDNTTNFSKN